MVDPARGVRTPPAPDHDDDLVSRYFFLESHISQQVRTVLNDQMRDAAQLRYALRHAVTFSAVFVLLISLFLLFSPVRDMTHWFSNLLPITNAENDPLLSLMLGAALYGLITLAALPGSMLALRSLGRRGHYSAWAFSVFLFLPACALILSGLSSGWGRFDWLRAVILLLALDVGSICLGLIVAFGLWAAFNTLQGVMGPSFYILRLNRSAPPVRSSGRSPEASGPPSDANEDAEPTGGARRNVTAVRSSVSRLRKSTLEALFYQTPSELEIVRAVIDRVDDNILEWPETTWNAIDRIAANRLAHLGVRSDLTSYILALLGVLAFIQVFVGNFSPDFSLLFATDEALGWMDLLPLLLPLVVLAYLLSLIRVVFLYFSRSQESVWTIEIIQHLAHIQMSRHMAWQPALRKSAPPSYQGIVAGNDGIILADEHEGRQLSNTDLGGRFTGFPFTWTVALILGVLSLIYRQGKRRR